MVTTPSLPTSDQINHVQNRDKLVDELIEELHGPSTKGKPYSISQPRVFTDWKESRGPWKDADTGQEILSELTPHQHYGVGVLLPVEEAGKEKTLSTRSEVIALELELPDEAENVLPIEGTAANEVEQLSKSIGKGIGADDIDVSEPENDQEASLFRGQSSLGVSFLIENAPNTVLSVELTGGRYDDFNANIANFRPRQWWIRRPISELLIFSIDQQNLDSRQKANRSFTVNRSNDYGRHRGQNKTIQERFQSHSCHRNGNQSIKEPKYR